MFNHNSKTSVRSKSKSTAIGVFAAMVLFASGCGPEMEATAIGVVTFQNQPSAHWMIAFQPVSDGPGSASITDEAGRYHMRTGSRAGLVPGKYRVALQPPPGTNLPEKFGSAITSGLEYEITPGKNVINIDL